MNYLISQFNQKDENNRCQIKNLIACENQMIVFSIAFFLNHLV